MEGNDFKIELTAAACRFAGCSGKSPLITPKKFAATSTRIRMISYPKFGALIVSMAPLLVSAQQLNLSFESGLVGFGSGQAILAASGPATNGVASAQVTPAAGGWTLGNHAITFGSTDFNGDSINDNVTLAQIAATGTGTVSFDIILSHTASFPVAADTWLQFHFAANSPGGWTQFSDIASAVTGMTNHTTASTGVFSASFTYTFAQLNWTSVGDWYQLNFGSNSEAAVPVRFYVDNIRIASASAVPEPSTSAVIAGVSVLGLAFCGRRRANRRG